MRLTIIDETRQRTRINRQRLHRVLDAALPARAAARVSLTVLLVDAATSAALHLQHFGDGEATDVMTFPDGSTTPRSGRVHLGDLAVCVDVARREAAARTVPVAHELTLYILHGLLHLRGYDDGTATSLARMWTAQRRLLKTVGIDIGAKPG